MKVMCLENPLSPPCFKTSVYSGSKCRSCYYEGIHIFCSYLLFLIINNIPWFSFWCNDFWYACPPELDQPRSIWSKSPVPFHENRSINSCPFRFDFLFYLLLSIDLCSVVMGFHYYVFLLSMQLCLIVWQSNASWQFSFSAGYGCEIEHPTPALLPSGMWHKCKCKRILALVQLCTCWTAVPVKSADTDVKSLNLIPCIGIHLKISSRTWNIHLYTLQSKRFLPFLYIKAHPCHVVNAGYLKQYFQLLCNHWLHAHVV